MNTPIPFHRPTRTPTASEALAAFEADPGAGWATRCTEQLKRICAAEHALLTPSCTVALELCALLADLSAGDEVILPSFTYVSSANPFVLRGAQLVFVDIDPRTMNVDAAAVAAAITPRTKVIQVMHYGGVACDMRQIMDVARERGIIVVEDAAHCVGAYWEGRHLGTIGHLGAFSFHHTKNLHCYEGGALLVNDPALRERAAILSEKGTNRLAFLEGKNDRYTWVDVGVSATMPELTAAYLLDQLQHLEAVQAERKALAATYGTALSSLVKAGLVEVPELPQDCVSNHHIVAIKTKDGAERSRLIAFLAERGIAAYFHYVPLHSAPAGPLFGRFHGEDRFTSVESGRLLRLPIYHGMDEAAVGRVVDEIGAFFA
jgi:dTDP-4-amino-4,6-dideoxygalactose transaminase